MNGESGLIVSERDSTDGFIERYIKDKGYELKNKGKDGKNIFLKAMSDQLPKMLFFLLPVFALILKLFYVRRKFRYLEHIIFSLHLHTFIFILLFFVVFFSYYYVTLAVLIIILVYTFFALRNVYKQSIFKTLVKLFFILLVYLISFIPAAIVLLLLTVIFV